MNYVDSFKLLAAHTFMHKDCSVNHKPWVYSKCLFKISYNFDSEDETSNNESAINSSVTDNITRSCV